MEIYNIKNLIVEAIIMAEADVLGMENLPIKPATNQPTTIYQAADSAVDYGIYKCMFSGCVIAIYTHMYNTLSFGTKYPFLVVIFVNIYFVAYKSLFAEQRKFYFRWSLMCL